MAHTYLDLVYGSLEKGAQMTTQPYCSKILIQDLKKIMKLSLGRKKTPPNQTQTSELLFSISLFLSLMVHLFHIFSPLYTEES